MDPITSIEYPLGAGSFPVDVFDKSVQAFQLYSTTKSLSNLSAHLVAKLLLIEECQAQVMAGESVCVSDQQVRRIDQTGE